MFFWVGTHTHIMQNRPLFVNDIKSFTNRRILWKMDRFLKNEIKKTACAHVRV